VVTVERDLKLDAHMDVHVVASGENAIGSRAAKVVDRRLCIRPPPDNAFVTVHRHGSSGSTTSLSKPPHDRSAVRL
jgi:hypothetical protein